MKKRKNTFPLALLAVITIGIFIYSLNITKPKDINPSKAVLEGDCNTSNTVDIIDFQLLSNSFGKSAGQAGYYAGCDFDTSNSITILDFQVLSNNFGRTGTTNTPTQRPSTTVTQRPSTTPTRTLTPTTGPLPTSGNVSLRPFGIINLTSSDIKFNVNGTGSNVDTIGFWEAPDPTQSLMFVSSKGVSTQVEVYKYPFTSQLRSLDCGPQTNGIWVDQERDVLYVTQRYTHHVCAFNLPAMTLNSSLTFDTPSTGAAGEPNLAMLKLTNGQRRIYVSYDTLVHYHNADTGANLGRFTPSRGLETMFGDNFYQQIYIPDESGRSGVYIYDPNGSPVGSKFGDSTIFDLDEEGIWVYKCPSTGTLDNGEGLIVVADQKTTLTDFEFFNRRSKAHLGKVTIAGVNNTDGISFTQQASPAYPKGIFAAIDDDTSTVGVGWDVILARTGLSCGN